MSSPPQKVNRPLDTPFKQQRIPGWKPTLTAGTVTLHFMAIGVILTAVGVAILLRNRELQEYQFDYTNCKQVNSNRTCSSLLQTKPLHPCVCLEAFQLSEDFKAPVYMYYGLVSFYQNFRRYVQSRDDKQLLGRPLQSRYQCDPYRTDKATGKTIFPCGLVANSLFNDTLRLKHKAGTSTTYREVGLIFQDISWPTERQRKFRNPPPGTDLSLTVKPPNWPKAVADIPGGLQNEAFIVWMRTAGLPTFRKLYAFVDHSSKPEFNKVLPAGNYLLEVHYNYPVWQFEGRKLLVLSNASWLGSRNPFLGIAFVCVGSLCLSLTVVFTAIHRRFGTKKFPLPELSAFYEPPRDAKQQASAAHATQSPAHVAGTSARPTSQAPQMPAHPVPSTAPHGRPPRASGEPVRR